MIEPRKRIGMRMKARREYLRLTQGQIAQRLGVQTSTVSNYESGNRPMAAEDIDALAKILRVRPGYFYDDEAEIEEADFIRYYRGAPPILQRAARDLLRQAHTEDAAAETTHGHKAE